MDPWNEMLSNEDCDLAGNSSSVSAQGFFDFSCVCMRVRMHACASKHVCVRHCSSLCLTFLLPCL